jgi:quinol monooxygenase YgiN
MTTILHVVAHIEAAEGFEAEVRSVLEGYCEPTRAEAGCLRYDLFHDNQHPRKFTFIEEWESEAHLAAHAQSAHINAGRAALQGKLAVPNWVQRLTQLR